MTKPQNIEELKVYKPEIDQVCTLKESDCPVAMDEILEYVAWEAFGYPEAASECALEYILHAKIHKTDYWIWSYKNEEQIDNYVVVRFTKGFLNKKHLSTYYQQGLSAEQLVFGLQEKIIK